LGAAGDIIIHQRNRTCPEASITTLLDRAVCYSLFLVCFGAQWASLQAQGRPPQSAQPSVAKRYEPFALSPEYKAVQQRLGRGWNSWDVNSVTTQVLLPEGLAIHLSLKHNSTLASEALLTDTLIGRLAPNAEQVFPGPHAWDGSYTDLRASWKGHNWRVQTGHAGEDLVMLATPLPSDPKTALASSVIFSVNFLWNRKGTASGVGGAIEAQSPAGTVRVYCTCEPGKVASTPRRLPNISPLTGPYFAADFTEPVAISTGQPRSLAQVQAALEQAHALYDQSLSKDKNTQPIMDAIETTLGWDTIYEPEKGRVVSPVSRVWSVMWGGYVIFDWDTFFAATMASIGDRDLAYADAIETLRETTSEGFVPNYARAGNWKSFDRSEPPVGAITVLGLYKKFGDRWFLSQAFPALLSWNRWWADHREIDGYMAWGSDGGNPPGNLDDSSRGTRAGAILESGLDNSPMYDDTVFDSRTHLLQFADVGLMSMYIADCDALATIADTIGKTKEAQELRARSTRMGEKLQTLWSPKDDIFQNKNLRTGLSSGRLSPTNFYPMLAKAASPKQAKAMVDRHLLNPQEFWGQWVIPSISREDEAYKDQDYWRGRIWGPMNFLVYLGLENYDLPQARSELAAKSYTLFLEEWRAHGHVHENYNANLGTGDDVSSSDRFYHWGALLGFTEYLEKTRSDSPARQE
jgi:putative isomerase